MCGEYVIGPLNQAGFSALHSTHRYMTGELRDFFYDCIPGSWFSKSQTEYSAEGSDLQREAEETGISCSADMPSWICPEELYPIYVEHHGDGCSAVHLLSHVLKSISGLAGTITLLAIAGTLFLCTSLRHVRQE